MISSCISLASNFKKIKVNYIQIIKCVKKLKILPTCPVCISDLTLQPKVQNYSLKVYTKYVSKKTSRKLLSGSGHGIVDMIPHVRVGDTRTSKLNTRRVELVSLISLDASFYCLLARNARAGVFRPSLVRDNRHATVVE